MSKLYAYFYMNRKTFNNYVASEWNCNLGIWTHKLLQITQCALARYLLTAGYIYLIDFMITLSYFWLQDTRLLLAILMTTIWKV